MRTDCITDEELAAWANGNAKPELAAAIQEHVSTCSECRTVAAEVARTAGERPLPKTLGRYELRELVGAGGMGTVYDAWDATVQRRVAVKLLHEAAADGHRAQRFVFERQVLASLDHPHIARLLDAGETDDGRPWFAMEFVDGRPLDVACDARKLTPRQRVELMLPVLRAVTSAHQHLVVHRDLKPSNIIVDADGAPHLVDFGIARLLEGANGLTQTGVAPMTPAYASPEQVRREPAAVQSDVYSLGVVLYELLSGVSPYDTKHDDVENVLSAVSRGDVRPLTRAVEVTSEAAVAARGLSREKLKSALSGDLEAIVMMALRKEPGDRYASVEALTDDLVASLEGRPTIARRGERAYRAALFVRRNRALLAGVTAAFIALSLGLVTTIWQARRAEARFEQVRSLAKTVLFEYHDRIAELPGSTPLREKLVQDAQSYLSALDEQSGNDLSLKQELAESYVKLGSVQGDPFAASLGDTAAAKVSYAKARSLAEAVLAKKPGDDHARRTLAELEVRFGDMEEVAGNTEAALDRFVHATELDEALLKERPDDLDRKLAVARDARMAARMAMQLARTDEALTRFSRALELNREALLVRPEPKTRRDVAVSLLSVARLKSEQVEHEEAGVTLEQAEAMFKQLVAEFPDSFDYRRGLNAARTQLSEFNRIVGNYPRALEYAKAGDVDARSMLKEDPKNAVARRDVVVSASELSTVLGLLERYDEAVVADAEALAILRQSRLDDPEDTQTLRDFVQMLSTAAINAVNSKRLEEAEAHIHELREAARSVAEDGAETFVVAEEAAMAHDILARVAIERGDLSRALEEREQQLEALGALLKRQPGLTRVANRVAIAQCENAEVHVWFAEKTGKRADWEAALAAITRAAELRDVQVNAGTAVSQLVNMLPTLEKARAKCTAALRR